MDQLSGSGQDLSDKRPDIADVIYEIHRCPNSHGDEIAEGFELTPIAKGGRAAYFNMADDGTVQLSASVVLGLLAVIIVAPENKGQLIPPTYQVRLAGRVIRVSEWWGRDEEFRKLTNVEGFPPGVVMDFGAWWDNWKPV